MKLSDLVFEAVSDQVEIAPGASVSVRALTHAELVAIRAAIPPPSPPMVPDPNRGSLAPKIENRDDPAYIRAADCWQGKFERARVAIAAGYELDSVSFAQAIEPHQWIVEAAERIGREYPDAVIIRLSNAIVKLCDPAVLAEKIRKN